MHSPAISTPVRLHSVNSRNTNYTLFTYTIRKTKTRAERRLWKQSLKRSVPTEQGKPPELVFGEPRSESFKRHFERCLFKPGDEVVFKKPKRNKIRGVVEYIENDINKIFWSEGGGSPRYIKVKIETVDKTTGEIKSLHMWTCENRLLWGSMK
jgi:hypothetical protein